MNLLFSAVAFYLKSYFSSEVHFHLWIYLDSLNLFFRFASLLFISEVAFSPWNIFCENNFWSLKYQSSNLFDLWFYWSLKLNFSFQFNATSNFRPLMLLFVLDFHLNLFFSELDFISGVIFFPKLFLLSEITVTLWIFFYLLSCFFDLWSIIDIWSDFWSLKSQLMIKVTFDL